jgi:DNA-binding response OmpR family regulator
MKAPPGRNRILIVEDDAMQAQILNESLTSAGFVVDVVSNGLEAVENIEVRNYDAVLVDYNIPEMDGLTVARVVRDILGPAARPVLIALASVPERLTLRERGSESAFDVILAKSCGLMRLIRDINRCIYSDPHANTRQAAAEAIYSQVERDFTFGPVSHNDDREQIKILVVEDDELQRLLLTNILRGRGYAVDSTSDGLQAFRHIRDNYFDIAIVDYRIPEMDGAAVASLIHDQMAQAWRPRLIAYTASPDLLRNRITRAGPVFDEIVDKSSNVDELLSIIRCLLQRSPNPTTRRLASASINPQSRTLLPEPHLGHSVPIL